MEFGFCIRCGTKQMEGARFCPKCGWGPEQSPGVQPAPMPSRPAVVPPAVPPPLPQSDFLRVTNPLQLKAKNLLVVQVILLGLSPLTGGFKYTFLTMLDSMLLIPAIALTSMVFVDPDEKRSVKWLWAGAIAMFAGVIAMSIALGVSEEGGWRGFR